jgi:hypothetical protein
VRCDELIADYQRSAAKNRENGKKGGRPVAKNNPVGSQSVPSGNPLATTWKGNQEPLTINQEPKKERAAPSALPDWMPVTSWSGYLEMRKAIKKPPTARAIELLIVSLDKMRAAGQDVGAVLDKSVANNWTDVYPIKPEWSSTQVGQGRGNAPTNQSRHSGFENIDYSEGIENGRIL